MEDLSPAKFADSIGIQRSGEPGQDNADFFVRGITTFGANTSPLIAHYLTLTHTWLTNISFYLIILGTLAIIAYNSWTPSSNFLSAMVTQACLYLPL